MHVIYTSKGMSKKFGVRVIYRKIRYIFWFDKRVSKDITALTSQCLAAANDMPHCFSLLPAESAGWIPIKQENFNLVYIRNKSPQI
jgi:hypothetical protein